MIKRNQLGVLFNAYQGKTKKVLTVCSAGCLRSPTAAHILSSQPWNFNTRCAGTSKEYAIIPVTEALIAWADIILVMDSDQQKYVNDLQNKLFNDIDNWVYDFQLKEVVNLEIDDVYEYRSPALIKIMTDKFHDLFSLEEQ
jgi:predicted protein tyrosine phosphatase